MKTFKELVKAKGLTQKDLARYVGISERAISHWNSGRNLPSLEEAFRVSLILGVSLERLATIFIKQKSGGKENEKEKS
jgi:transcriptional regulator with XRE-family HTH domain